MPVPQIGFRAAYGSNRALDADYSAFITHGALIVRIRATDAPDPDTPVRLRIVAPGEHTFDFDGVAGQMLKKGLMVSFEDAAEARTAIAGFIASEGFKRAVSGEPEDAMKPPTFAKFDPASAPAPAPADDPFDDATPIDQPGAPLHPDIDTAPQVIERDPTTGLHPDIDTVARKKRKKKAAAVGLHPDIDKLPAKRGAAAQRAEKGSTTIRKPAPSSEFTVFVVKYATVADFVEVKDDFERDATLPIPADPSDLEINDVARVKVTLPGRNVYELDGVVEGLGADTVLVRVDENDETFRKLVLYPTTIAARKRLETERPEDRGPPTVIKLTDVAPDEDFDKMPIRRRLARMGMDDKINMALSGNREERMALAMDGNRAVHHYLLKNAKITLDEIAFMSRLPSLNPDVLDKIAENPMYTQNPTVTKALVYNPKTPIRTAIRLLDRLPRPEIMNLAKRSNMNLRLVMAAKKKIERFKG
ncbi:MAG: hypothetical protein RMA76_45095 [Deltaproteobacteria bacterium]|jgi:hypothetical protein